MRTAGWLLLLTSTLGAQTPPDRDPLLRTYTPGLVVSVPLQPGDLADILPRLAAGMRVPFGIEVPHDEPLASGRLLKKYRSLGGMTLGDLLDELIRADGERVHWTFHDGVIVVRPRAAQPSDFLARPVRDLALADADVGEAIDVILKQSRGYGTAAAVPFDDRRLSIALSNGTVADALDALARAHGELIWAVRYEGDEIELGVKNFRGRERRYRWKSSSERRGYPAVPDTPSSRRSSDEDDAGAEDDGAAPPASHAPGERPETVWHRT
jgi:hypothetical protein